MCWRGAVFVVSAGAALYCCPAVAHAQPVPIPVPVPVPVPAPPGPGVGLPIAEPAQGFLGSGPGVGQAPGLGEPGVAILPPTLAPAAAGIFLCPGVGAAGNSFGGGGGYCDFNFQQLVGGRGNLHDHCEWGGFVPVVEMWQCWRVFPGQPDHPRLPDPDIVPDGWGTSYALTGPTPDNQWPPAGLIPPGQPPEPPPPPEGTPP
jgi:hypothetical protein